MNFVALGSSPPSLQLKRHVVSAPAKRQKVDLTLRVGLSKRRCALVLAAAAAGAGRGTRVFKVCLCDDKYLVQCCRGGLWLDSRRQVGKYATARKELRGLKRTPTRMCGAHRTALFAGRNTARLRDKNQQVGEEKKGEKTVNNF